MKRFQRSLPALTRLMSVRTTPQGLSPKNPFPAQLDRVVQFDTGLIRGNRARCQLLTSRCDEPFSTSLSISTRAATTRASSWYLKLNWKGDAE